MTRQDIVDECFPQRKKKKRVRDKDTLYNDNTIEKCNPNKEKGF